MAHNMKYNPSIAGTWKYCWTKLRVYDQTEWDKIVFLDCDIMLIKNIDHLFDLPNGTAAVDGEYSNIWPNRPHFNNGCVVIEPDHKVFEDIFNFANNLKKEDFPDWIIADQEILELYFKDWPNQKELHLNKYYDLFGPYLQEEQRQDIADNCYFIHFIGRKPWVDWVKNPRERYDEHWYEVAKKAIDEVVAQLDWVKIREKLVLTVYAICKNEKDFVDRWLKWTLAEADYVCVLDTGSTDGTWQRLQRVAKKNPKLIIGQKEITPWRFDYARNESMTLVPKETNVWFMADLDEIIKEPGWAKNIKDNWTPMFNRGRYTYNRQVDEHDNVLKQMEEFRVHSRKWYKWINVVHEALINYKGTKYFPYNETTPLHFVVWHYPKKTKEVNYAELCEEHLKLYPDDALMELQLAIEYEIAQNFGKAAEHFLNLIHKPQGLQAFELSRCYIGMGRIFARNNDLFNALNYFREGRLVYPAIFDNYIFAAEIYYKQQQWAATIKLIEDGFRLCRMSTWCSIVDVHSYYGHELLGLSALRINDLPKALAHLTMAQHLNTPTKEIDNALQQLKDYLIEHPEEMVNPIN